MASQGRHGAKTRTACLTCKARKVKCSEEKPGCRRCIKAGRICGGYQLVLVDGTSTIINRSRANLPTLNSSNTSLLSAFSATEDEWQAYRLYTQRIACRLGGAFDTDLWQKLVIQISHGDATVRNGVFALGNLFRHRRETSPTKRHISTCSCSYCLRALRAYNKSITSFPKSVARLDDPASVNAALASCAVFICIEYYRMNDRNAIALTDKGCGMLFESRHTIPGFQKRDLFGRLRVLSATFGYTVARPLLGRSPTAGDMPGNLSDRLERARSSLYDIMAASQALRLQSFQVLVPLWALSSPSISIETLHNDRDAIISRLQTWGREFAELRKLLWSKPLESSLPALILHAHFLKTKIYTETSLDISQDRYDEYLSEFQGIADAAGDGLPQLVLPADDKTANFSFETCFLSTLYLSVLKCRQPALRRRLLALMRLSREKEGLWHRDESIRVATRVMELEEGRSDFVPDGNDRPITNVPIRFHDVLCGVNYVDKDGRTMVDVTYVLCDEHSEHQWQCMKETLLVDE
ncbi:hypothetical protein LTS15_008081 [Exophiala xenobiotica]|nr:hypothetical protein LTS15_008081 [Exophiala xenobiotica]